MVNDGNFHVIWNEAMKQIRAGLDEQEFYTWFNLDFIEADESSFTVAVPSIFYQDQVRKRYQDYIEGKIEELIGRKPTLKLVVRPREGPAPSPEGEKSPLGAETAPKQTGENARKAAAAPLPYKKGHPQLREDYSFDTYVVGDNNSFAANAAQAIARNPGKAYNPFLIYGGSGLGKTHLMQAIGNYIHASTELKLIYVSAETFTNEFIEAIQGSEKAKTAFKNRYRYTDILLMDDIHFLQKKDGTQEELFYTFNALYDAKKQMVFTCDRPISELKDFNDRLRSRLGQRLNVDLQPPNYETRCAILKKKAKAAGVVIPDDVIDLVSKNISTNVRDLESALHTLTAYVELVGKPVTVEIAQQRLKDVFASPRQANISIEIIQRVVAEKFNLSPNDLKGKKRTQSIVYPRQLSMYIIREITEYTTTEIGTEFGGRDHTTVMHACQKIEERIKSDSSIDSIIQGLIRAIKEYSAKS
ncbi:MAG: chromosomal replication initiator protein DnaA [Treponema sp.]|jgi:chromosomal replication initiator protein|nr:chromosomal replication initiator protein DnaA [Treponema sp.]